MAGLVACVNGPSACTAEIPARSLDAQLAAGERAYHRSCAPCHDLENAIGPDLTARVLVTYETAGRLDQYVRLTMPYGDVASVNDQEYWDVLAYLVTSRGLADLGSTLGAEVADTLTLAQ